MKAIPLVFITDDTYSLPTGVAIMSAIQSKKAETKYDISIITYQVSSENKERLLRQAAPNVTIRLIEAANVDIDDYREQGYYVSPSSLLKFSIPDFLPDVKKVLYLDGDILVKQDLTELFEMPLKKTYAAGVRDMAGEVIARFHDKLSLDRYLNSGMMLLNLDLMRRDDLTNRLYRTKKEHPEYQCMDQDVFNDVFRGNITWLPPKYNLMFANLAGIHLPIEDVNRFYGTGYDSYEEMIDDACIIHLTNERKPWLYRYTFFAQDWRQIYQKSSFHTVPLHYKDNWSWYIGDFPVLNCDRLMNSLVLKVLGFRVLEYKRKQDQQKLRLFHITVWEHIKRPQTKITHILKLPVFKIKKTENEVLKSVLGIPVYRRRQTSSGRRIFVLGVQVNHRRDMAPAASDRTNVDALAQNIFQYLDLHDQFRRLKMLSLMASVPQNNKARETIIRHIDDPAPLNIEYPEGYRSLLPYMSFSQMGQDRCVSFILRYFCGRDPSHISYLDIGAAEPIGDNNTFLFYCLGARGVLVDPNTRLLTKAYSLRPGDVILEGGIAFDNKKEADYYDFGIPGQGHNTFDKKSADAAAKQFELVSVTPKKLWPMNEILETYFKKKAPDFVSIDVEGVDFKIIQSIDFNRWRPTVFCIENQTKELITYMEKNGYRYIANSSVDTLFVDEGSLQS